MHADKLRCPCLASRVVCVRLAEIHGLSESPLAISVQIQAREAAAEENLLGSSVAGSIGLGFWERLVGFSRGWQTF